MMIERQTWDEFYLWDVAGTWAKRSRDPSTKVGAVIVRADHTQASVGYNDFARGIDHDIGRYVNRDFKLHATVHAEENAIFNARETLDGYTIYSTFSPCPRCANAIIQKGITRVVIPADPIPPRWAEPMEIALGLLQEARITIKWMMRKPL